MQTLAGKAQNRAKLSVISRWSILDGLPGPAYGFFALKLSFNMLHIWGSDFLQSASRQPRV